MLQESSPDLALAAVEPSPPQGERGTHARVAGPGWFDSSWELERGLEVREGWLGDDGLRRWIEEFLIAQRSAARTASPSASTAIA